MQHLQWNEMTFDASVGLACYILDQWSNANISNSVTAGESLWLLPLYISKHG